MTSAGCLSDTGSVARSREMCRYVSTWLYAVNLRRQTVFIAGSKFELGCNCDISFLSPTLMDLLEANRGAFILTLKVKLN